MNKKINSLLPEDGGTAVEEIGGEVDHDGQLGELLQQLPGRDGRVVGGAAADEQQPAAALDLGDIVLDAAQGDALVLKVDAAPHGVDHGLGLLEDLLLHERGVVALHDLLDLKHQGGDLAGKRKKHFTLIYVFLSTRSVC